MNLNGNLSVWHKPAWPRAATAMKGQAGLVRDLLMLDRELWQFHVALSMTQGVVMLLLHPLSAPVLHSVLSAARHAMLAVPFFHCPPFSVRHSAVQRREDAARAMDALDGVAVHDFEMRIGWGKSMTLPAMPVWAGPHTGKAWRQGLWHWGMAWRLCMLRPCIITLGGQWGSALAPYS